MRHRASVTRLEKERFHRPSLLGIALMKVVKSGHPPMSMDRRDQPPARREIPVTRSVFLRKDHELQSKSLILKV